jgi:hypothetical protein
MNIGLTRLPRNQAKLKKMYSVSQQSAFTKAFFTSKCRAVSRYTTEFNLFYNNNKSKASFLLILTKYTRVPLHQIHTCPISSNTHVSHFIKCTRAPLHQIHTCPTSSNKHVSHFIKYTRVPLHQIHTCPT